jgi:hypothetical protein
VFPVAPGMVALGLVLSVIIGWLVGMVSGAITTIFLGTGVRGIVKDGILRLTGFIVTSITFTRVPRLNSYRHPWLAGVLAASFLAVLHQLLRFKRLRSESKRA